MGRRTLRAVFLSFGLLSAGVSALVRADDATLRADFAAALAPPCWEPVYKRSRTPAPARPGMLGVGGTVLRQPWEAPATLAAARALAQKRGESALPFLLEHAKNAKDGRERGFALAVLVALADTPKGSDSLIAFVVNARAGGTLGHTLSLITDLHGPAARPLLERMVAVAFDRIASDPRSATVNLTTAVLGGAGALLGAVGDQNTRALFLQLLERAGDDRPLKPSAQALLDDLDARLSLPEADRAAWSRDVIEFMKVRAIYEGNISAENEAEQVGAGLEARGVRLGTAFLRRMLGKSPVATAVVVAGRQRETELIPDLLRIVEHGGRGYVTTLALDALGRIGTRESFAALLGLVRSDPPLPVAAPLSVLANTGDAAILRALQRLATDPSLSPAARADVVVARDYLGARLAGTLKPLMGVQPVFPRR